MGHDRDSTPGVTVMGLALFDAVGDSGLASRLRSAASIYARFAEDATGRCEVSVATVAGYLGLPPCIVRRYRRVS